VNWLFFDLNGTLLDPGDGKDELQQAVTLAMAETLLASYRPFSDFILNPPEPKLFDDVRAGLDDLAGRYRLAVLTNSGGEEAFEKLTATGIADRFEFVAGSDEVEAFKPHPDVYELGIERTGARPDDIALVAAHAWDLLGAAHAGMRTAYLARDGDWPEMLDEPDWQAPDLLALAATIE
jgi:FMN phosphatase YigB (HAD superfamily)